MKFSASTFTALVLVAASAPAHAAPLPLNSRGLGSIIEGIFGGGLKNIISDFVGNAGAAAPTASAASGFPLDVETTYSRMMLNSRRWFSDLSDEEVNTFFEWVNKQDKQQLASRSLVSGFVFPTSDSDCQFTSPPFIDPSRIVRVLTPNGTLTPRSNKRAARRSNIIAGDETFPCAERRSFLTSALEEAAKVLTPAALSGIEKLLGGGSASAATTPAATATPPA
ncbi:hypothetical protein C8R46DRAFT_1033090 [Mycena filopes]|nr:hypothetical protein C8R46DRAFT_1033090 [Mycena filopes]